jgi:hypothetical protein
VVRHTTDFARVCFFFMILRPHFVSVAARVFFLSLSLSLSLSYSGASFVVDCCWCFCCHRNTMSGAERFQDSHIRGDANLGDIIFKLNVNFLLYVVLIIVFYMLVRFYLEEETEMQHEGSGYALLSTLDEDEREAKDQTSSVSSGTVSSPTAVVVAAVDEGDREDQIELLHFDHTTAADNHSNKNGTKKSTTTTKTLRSSKSSNFLNLHDVSTEPEGTRQEVIQRLAVCCCGLVVSYCLWGLVQERILTQRYDGEFFEFSYGLVFMNRLGGLVLSGFLMWYFQVPYTSSPLWEYSFPSVANMLSSWCQYEVSDCFSVCLILSLSLSHTLSLTHSLSLSHSVLLFDFDCRHLPSTLIS